jgi:hypothetical protein
MAVISFPSRDYAFRLFCRIQIELNPMNISGMELMGLNLKKKQF